MKLLEKSCYGQLTFHLKEIGINNLFARSVIEQKINGRVYVDNLVNPETYYVVHPYGMSLLAGKTNNTEFNSEFLRYSLNTGKTRNKHEWMQAYPNDWDRVLLELYGSHLIKSADNFENREHGVIELNTRVNFKFNREKYVHGNRLKLPPNCEILRTDRELYEGMSGLVIPSNFWDHVDDFLAGGIGYSLLYEKKLAATAYSAYIHDDMLELGIETLPEFRGKGFAHLACCALIDYCLDNDLEPVWACRLENTGSFILAQKLGFEPDKMFPYYRLSN